MVISISTLPIAGSPCSRVAASSRCQDRGASSFRVGDGDSGEDGGDRHWSHGVSFPGLWSWLGSICLDASVDDGVLVRPSTALCKNVGLLCTTSHQHSAISSLVANGRKLRVLCSERFILFEKGSSATRTSPAVGLLLTGHIEPKWQSFPNDFLWVGYSHDERRATDKATLQGRHL